MIINGKLSLILGLLVISISLCAQEKLNIRAASMNGATLINAAVGEPFLIEVILQNASAQINTPQIAHDGVHVPRYCGFKMSSVNGKMTVTYQYQLRIDEPGEFTLGPAKIVDNQKVVTSDPVKLRVTDQEKVPEQKKTRSHRTVKEPFMRLTSHIKEAVVGQRVPVTATFYYQAGKQELVQIHESDDVDGVKSSRVKNGPYQGTTTIDGTEYQFLMYSWDVYPTQAGTVVIPALGADYSNVPDRDDFFGAFASLLNRATALKRLYSNALTIQVTPLPAHAKDVQAIGTFTLLQADIAPSVAKLGQGMTYKLTLEGDGNFESMETPQLQNIPDSCKWYESKKNIIRDKESNQIEFEYVLQGITPGDWDIPEQTIVYYDTTTHRVGKINSQPISITILSDGASAIGHDNNQLVGQAVDFEQVVQPEAKPLVVPIKQYGPIQYSSSFYIPWNIFMWIIIALLFLLLLYYVYSLTWGRPTVAMQLLILQREIKSLQKNNSSRLYQLMRQAVGYSCENKADITVESAANCAAQAGISELQQQAFVDYWQSLEQDQYYQSRNFEQLKNISIEWLNILSKSKLAQKKLVLLLLFATFNCLAINIQETFLQANLFMDSHNYDKALELYQSIPKKGYSILFNSAIAYYQKNDFVHAASSAYQAQQIASNYDRYNQAQQLINLSLEKLSLVDEQSMIEKLYSKLLPVPVFFIQCLLLLLLIGIVWVLIRKKALRLAIPLIGGAMLLMSMLYIHYYHATYKKSFLIKETSLLAAPTNGIDQVGTLPQGSPVQIINTKDLWSKIRNKNLVGWVLSDTLTAVEK